MEIKNNLLKGDNVRYVKTSNHGEVFGKGDMDTVVLHYTAGPSVDSSVKTLCNPRVKASAHIVIGRDGSIVQLVPFNIISWHAGKSNYGNRVGYNKYSIGIELENAGVLSKSANGYDAWFGKTYSEDEVMMAVHRNESRPKYWHTYTEKQMLVVEEVCELLIDTYGVNKILGHEEIAPGRKIDPGPAFPLNKFRKRLLSVDLDEDGEELVAENQRVAVPKLNIRKAPSAQADRADAPLEGGTKVKVVDEANGWTKVKVKKVVEGWVSARFIDKV